MIQQHCCGCAPSHRPAHASWGAAALPCLCTWHTALLLPLIGGVRVQAGIRQDPAAGQRSAGVIWVFWCGPPGFTCKYEFVKHNYFIFFVLFPAPLAKPQAGFPSFCERVLCMAVMQSKPVRCHAPAAAEARPETQKHPTKKQ